MKNIHQKRNLPPLSALRAFEAAARHLSFRRAADELVLTPTAISHQIRQLEERLGMRLFLRQTRQVALTEAGNRLYPALREAFDGIGEALAALAPTSERATVTVSATCGFTARWLVPRLPAFAAAHPDIDLHLHASDLPVDLHQGRVDLAVRYARGHAPDLHGAVLFPCRFAPVCSPRLDLRDRAGLATTTRLRFQWQRQGRDIPDWPRWFRKAGMRMPEDAAELAFSDESHAILAAVSGQGVMLANLVLVAEELRSGALLRPFGPSLQGLDMQVLWPPRHQRTPAVLQVRDWLLAESTAFIQAQEHGADD